MKLGNILTRHRKNNQDFSNVIPTFKSSSMSLQTVVMKETKEIHKAVDRKRNTEEGNRKIQVTLRGKWEKQGYTPLGTGWDVNTESREGKRGKSH